MEAAFVVYAIPFRFRNTSSSLSRVRNGQLLQDVWAVTRRPSTVSVCLGPTFTTMYHIHPPGPRTTLLPSTFHPLCTLRPQHMHNSLATLGSLGQTSGIPFPRLFSSCLWLTCIKFRTCQIHVLNVPLRALASETCYPPSDATIAVGLSFKGHDDPYQRTFRRCWEEGQQAQERG